MRPFLIRYVCILFCLWSSQVLAENTLDPFNTEAMLPLKPALRLGGAVGDPCAEAMPNGALNLLDVVNLALCNNPQTREAWANARVQVAQVGVSEASYLPNLSLTASGIRSRVEDAPSVYQRNIGLSLSYLLYDFGARAANLENARQLVTAANATQDSTVQAIFLSAVQSFYQTQATLAALDAARESERAAKESFAAANARYVAGSATPADKLQAQTAYSQATLNRITADGNMKNAKGTLANMLGLDANQNISLVSAERPLRSGGTLTDAPLTDASPEGESLQILAQDIRDLIEEARQHRPDLYAAVAQVKAAEASVDAARTSDKPSISLNASTNQSNSTGINTLANQSSGAGNTSRGSSVGISLSVPIFSGFAPTYRIRAAEAQVETKNAQLERLRLQVALDVWTAYQNLTTAAQSLRSTADLLNSAEQSERVALGRYKAGVGSILDVLNAQSALASARQQRIQSMFNWNIGRATLAQAMGGLNANLLQTLPDALSKQSSDTPQQRIQP